MELLNNPAFWAVVGSVVGAALQALPERMRQREDRRKADLQIRREIDVEALDAADGLIAAYRRLTRLAVPVDQGRSVTEEEDANQLEAMREILAAFGRLRLISMRVIVLGSAAVGFVVEAIRQEMREMHDRMVDERIINAEDFNSTMDRVTELYGELMLAAKADVGTERPSRVRAWWHRRASRGTDGASEDKAMPAE
ncbi:MAG: hypothetical protein LBK95_17180 [Bifidobacteriaceae bacterium]|jgi:hypothetical protein|nr:hypothetical protein [Bifidobacteriaceae bacterium]